MGTAATKAKNKYNKNKYERVNLVVTPEFKSQIKNEAERNGESLNGFISHVLKDKMAESTEKDILAPDCFRFSVFYNEELVSDVDVGEKEVKIRRYSMNPAKQLFYADRIPRFKLGEILALRCWDRERADLRECLLSIGLSEYNPYEICRRTHGITYADRLWFRYEGEFFDGISVLEAL